MAIDFKRVKRYIKLVCNYKVDVGESFHYCLGEVNVESTRIQNSKPTTDSRDEIPS